MNKKNFIVTILCLIVSLITGFIFNDLIIGGSILFTGLLCAYFASEGKRINYILGLINYLLMSYVAFKNNLFGIFFFYIFIFSPLQVNGFISWNKNLNKDNNVNVREFTLKNSITPFLKDNTFVSLITLSIFSSLNLYLTSKSI